MFIIPAIDIIDGKCVRLTQGDYAQKKVYNENPLEVAKMFEAAGLKRLHLVDLDGAKSGHIINYKVLENIAKGTSLTIDFGGGVKTDSDIQLAFNSGAAQVTGGSIAVKNPDIFSSWIKNYGDKIILGADVKDEKIATNGWLEDSGIDLWNFLADYVAKGAEYTVCTDISKDGALQGTATELYKKMIAKFPKLNVIASGGVTTMQDLHDLKAAGCYGAIVGKAIYENRISLKELEIFNI
ncbi:MAG: 1-(5-phosphoribosyl)-5-[(5-phosphoribosylamino)methylideneamino]imidazole-4-carboxamide isomerase [Flavobacteriales bacterium]